MASSGEIIAASVFGALLFLAVPIFLFFGIAWILGPMPLFGNYIISFIITGGVCFLAFCILSTLTSSPAKPLKPKPIKRMPMFLPTSRDVNEDHIPGIGEQSGQMVINRRNVVYHETLQKVYCCPECGSEVEDFDPSGKEFPCENCGALIYYDVLSEPGVWKCDYCDALNYFEESCYNCGAPKEIRNY
jgi:ribosomal protein L37AE/L43A